MQLVERHIMVGNKAMESLCHRSGLLFNVVNYYYKQSVLKYIERFGEFEFSKLCVEFEQPDFRALPCGVSQQVVRQIFHSWKVFFSHMRAWGKDKTKFRGKPKYPNYKKGKKLNIVIFTKSDFRFKKGYIHFPKRCGLSPIKTLQTNIAQVRLVPQTNCIVVEVVYEREVVKVETQENLFLSIDLGVNNLATAISNTGEKPFIIDGRRLKSVNQFYNKQRAKLNSYIGNRGTSERINTLTFKRNKIVEDILHKTSDYIVDYCVKHKIETIVVGKNKNWKQGLNLGSKTNQSFTSIPHARLINKIGYKAALVGIKLIEQEENHTSKVDHLAGETIEHHETYLGKRKNRGLFQSSVGKLINADVNGAIGIALKSKVADDSFVKMIAGSGFAFNPSKIYLTK